MKIASHPELSKALADALENGPIPFRRFMELALYHPQGGYYCRESSRIGPDGDFYTSPHQSPWLGRMIAPLLDKIRRRLGEAPSLHIWEYGPGEGWLAFDILESIRSPQAAFEGAIAYTFAEQSAQASKRIREKFKDYDDIRFSDPADYPPSGFEGVVLAHEFLDALPVHALIHKENDIKERYVAWRDDKLLFCEGAPTDERLNGWFSDLGVRLSTERMAEVNLCAFDWVSEVARRMARGRHTDLRLWVLRARPLRPHPPGWRAARLQKPHPRWRRALPSRGNRPHHPRRLHLHPASGYFSRHGTRGLYGSDALSTGAGLAQALENAASEDDEKTRRERQSIMGIMDPTGLGGAIKVMLLAKNLELSDLSEFR